MRGFRSTLLGPSMAMPVDLFMWINKHSLAFTHIPHLRM